MDCKDCKSRWRADKLIDEYISKNPSSEEPKNYA
jgi:glycyl-tRNA synthetase (class II)